MWSTPPLCTSKRSPKYFMLITEHSRCQPGAPGPQGESHSIKRVASFGEALQSAKSVALRLPGVGATRPFPESLEVEQRELPVVGDLGGVEVEARFEFVCVALLLERARELDHLLDVVGRLRPYRGRANAELVEVIQEDMRVVAGDVPDRATLLPRGELELVPRNRATWPALSRHTAPPGPLDAKAASPPAHQRRR